MYLEHFHLREQPFSITPDTSYFFQHQAHQEAMNVLLISLEQGEGFIKITGEVGTGKTLLCRKLLNHLSEQAEYVTAYIPNPNMSPSALNHALADELCIEATARTGQHKLFKLINDRLIELARDDKKVILCIDESQAMPEQTLEALRLLSNLETEKSKLLQIVLFGQPELNNVLARESIRQLRQRISFSYQLAPLDRQSVRSYIRHRLMIAGYAGNDLFTPAACDVLFKISNGVPRIINILAHKAMLVAYGKGQQTIKKRYVRMAAADTDETSQRTHRSFAFFRRAALSALSVMMLAGLGIYSYAGPLS